MSSSGVNAVPVQQKDQPFPKYARDYFEQLRQQYQLLLDETKVTAPPSIVALIARAQQAPESVTWADVFTLETAYLFALCDSGDVDRVRLEVILARNRYRDIVGVDEYLAYAATVPADITKLGIGPLKAELLTLAERIRYLYTFVPPKEAVRNKLAMRAGWTTLVAALLGILVYGVFEWGFHHTIVTILVVLFVGQMGGFLSVQQRLQSSTGVDPLFKELQLTNGWFSVVVIAPISGALFAIILYFMFVGGLMSGGLFPHFGPAAAPALTATAAATPAPTPTPAPGPLNVTQFLVMSAPSAIEDWGKLLVWAFIAGFAERFVPDVLTRMSGGQAGPGGPKPAGGTAIGTPPSPNGNGPQAPEGDPNAPKPEGDPNAPKPEGDPNAPKPEGDPNAPPAASDPNAPKPEGDPNAPPVASAPNAPKP